MHKLIFVVLAFLISAISVCQEKTYGERIEEIVQPTVLFLPMGGSGILIQDTSNLIHIVTAKHVIYNPSTGFSSLNESKCEVVYYPVDFISGEMRVFEFDLTLLEKEGNILADKIQDICVIKIAYIDSGSVNYYPGVIRHGKRMNLEPYPINRAISSSRLNLGEEIIVTGYPTSIGIAESPQFDYLKPLAKRGSIAGKSDKFDTFVIDCNLHHGNSGGPVFLIESSTAAWTVRLVGIVSQRIPLREEAIILDPIKKVTSNQSNSTYSVVVPIDFAQKLLLE